ncbi:MAG: hypothetical protein AWU57_471 [Marinobacter sp. T13-3]|mgnify:CR=1 FL=1|nr:MAG: hypothetical protein AWU57_471 [Marinobacter sp. T13-3]
MTTQYLVEQPFTGSILSLVVDGYVEFSGYLYNNGGPDLTVEEYAAKTGKNVVALSGDQVDAEIAAFNQRTYLDAPARRITLEQFVDALETLPPQAYLDIGRFERFNMMEHLNGTITTQYVRYGDTCLCLNVDTTNKDTWVTRDNFETVLAGARDARAETA